MAGTHPLQQGRTWKNEKKLQKVRPKKFWSVKGGAEGFFHVLLGDGGGGSG